MNIPVSIAGIGKYLPEQRVTNADLSKIVDTSDEWITQRTGIKERRRAAPDQCSSSLASKAARMALEDSGLAPEDIGLVIVCTATPDQAFPATAVQVVEDLELPNSAGWDLSAACSGFVFGVQSGAQFVSTGSMGAVIVIGVETLTRILDYTDRTTCILFGDGAGAVVLAPTERSPGFEYIHGFMGAAPDREAIIQPAGGSRMPTTADTIAEGMNFLKMEGRKTFKFAVRTFADMVEKAVADYGGFAELGMVVPHQMNQRIIEAAADRLGLPIEIFYSNVHRYGNTSAASVPIAMREARDEGRFEAIKGKLACMCAFGSGLGFGHFLLRV